MSQPFICNPKVQIDRMRGRGATEQEIADFYQVAPRTVWKYAGTKRQYNDDLARYWKELDDREAENDNQVTSFHTSPFG